MADIDVVVTTYERPEALKRCLLALAQQSQAPNRVIVVDDCSPTPASEAVAAIDAPLSVEVIRFDANGGPARGRNRGVEAATAETVLFVDDDVVADRDLVAAHAVAHAAFAAPLAAIGPLRAPADWRPTAWNYWEAATLEFQYRRMERGEYAPTWRQFFTGNASVSKAAFLAAGGFDESLRRAEDVELALRMALKGCTFAFLPHATGWHYAHRTRASWQAIPGEYARADALIDRAHPELRWLRVVERERSRRHPLTRAATWTLSRGPCRAVVVPPSFALADRLFRAGHKRMSNALLSTVYSIEYAHALSEAEATTGSSLAAGPQPFNAASTVAEDDSEILTTAWLGEAE